MYEEPIRDQLQSPFGATICGVHGPDYWLVAKEPAVCIYVCDHSGPHSWEPEDD
jgi:hypothetical protein